MYRWYILPLSLCIWQLEVNNDGQVVHTTSVSIYIWQLEVNDDGQVVHTTSISMYMAVRGQ